MKKVAMLIALFVGFVGFSQDDAKTDEYRKAATKLVKLQTGDQMMAMLKPVEEMIPMENREAFRKEVRASLDKLYPSLATIYMESFSYEEISEILDFYETPLGKKMLAEMPKILNKSMEIGQQWGAAELRPMIMKYQTVQSTGEDEKMEDDTKKMEKEKN